MRCAEGSCNARSPHSVLHQVSPVPSTLHIVHSKICTAHCNVCTAHSVLHRVSPTLHCKICTVQIAICALHTATSTLCLAPGQPQSGPVLHWPRYLVSGCTVAHCICTASSALHSLAHCTLKTAHCKLHTAH